jgi:uncharacterized small protein (TIGR04563 family)
MFTSGDKVGSDTKRKQSLYFPDGMVAEISAEARRLDRSMSWVMQRAWRVAQASIAQMPGADGGVSG